MDFLPVRNLGTIQLGIPKQTTFPFLKYPLLKKNSSFPALAAGNDFKKNKWKLLFLIMKKQQNFILNLGFHFLQIGII